MHGDIRLLVDGWMERNVYHVVGHGCDRVSEKSTAFFASVCHFPRIHVLSVPNCVSVSLYGQAFLPLYLYEMDLLIESVLRSWKMS